MALDGEPRWMAEAIDLLEVDEENQHGISCTRSLSITQCEQKAL